MVPHHVRDKDPKPLWWSYDQIEGRWLMVDGRKVELTDEALEAFVVSHFDLQHKDEKGYYEERRSSKTGKAVRIYYNMPQLSYGIGEDSWWEFSQQLASNLLTA